MTPQEMVRRVQELASDWEFDAISLGYPGPVIHGKPAVEPQNLGEGWTRFDFYEAFNKRLKIINDAAMQALGSYEGGRMLFLGLGTGLGSTLILDDVVVPLELGELRYSRDETLEDRLGKAGRREHGQEKWEVTVHEVVGFLREAFVADYVVLGGGNAQNLRHLPEGAKRGDNRNAFYGGLRLWGEHFGVAGAKAKKHTLVIT
jgi:polyphosphate glucokinase